MEGEKYKVAYEILLGSEIRARAVFKGIVMPSEGGTERNVVIKLPPRTVGAHEKLSKESRAPDLLFLRVGGERWDVRSW